MSADESSVWVRTWPTPEGTYAASIEFDSERSVTVTPTQAGDYAAAVLAAAMRASHDAAVFQQLVAKGISIENAGRTILSLRDDRPSQPSTGTILELEPGVNKVGAPFLTIVVDGQPVGQWTVDDARGHALHVLGAVIAADLDAAYYRHLVGTVGLSGDVARGVIGDLVGRLG